VEGRPNTVTRREWEKDKKESENCA
jgi:hypothetical protein